MSTQVGLGRRNILLRPVGDRAILVELPDRETRATLADDVRTKPPPGVCDVVEGAVTVLVRADSTHALHAVVAEIRDRLADASHRGRAPLADALTHSPQAPSTRAAPLVVPMTYDGPDLAGVAATLGRTSAELVGAHQRVEWVVDFPGFLPGFAYLVPAAEHDAPWPPVARKRTPRTRVPTGSVGLAGPWCGIYPTASPGGWQLIGTTPLILWDSSLDEPALLTPGRRIRFEATP